MKSLTTMTFVELIEALYEVAASSENIDYAVKNVIREMAHRKGIAMQEMSDRLRTEMNQSTVNLVGIAGRL